MDRQRRSLLGRAAALGAAAWLRPGIAVALAIPKFASYPFTLGVASGSPLPDGVVIWTRLAPVPLEGGGLGPEPIEVRWEVAHDAAFRRIAAQGMATARAEAAHSVHVEVAGLEPRREYHYRFMAGSEVSAVGRTCTAPAPGDGDASLRLALASCQQYEQGYYVAHRHLAREEVDVVAFVGDYIYESSWGHDHVRKHGSAIPYTLAEYRDRYARYKTDADLQRSHAAAPWIVTWDDHEVENDYANDRSERLYPHFLERRAAAYRAFIEHMPVRATLRPDGSARIFGRHEWGRLATLHVLDDRQYRSHQACPKPNRGGSNVVGPECAERLDGELTLLGRDQEAWLDEGLAQSRTQWNLVVQQTLFVPAGVPGKSGRRYWTDGWDGYPAARERLIASLVARKPMNPVILGGDVHASYFADVHARPEDADSPIVAAEFCGTSITSEGPSAKAVQAILEANRHIRYGNGNDRGYVLLDIREGGLQARLRAVQTVKRDDSPIANAAAFVVEPGRPGLQPA
ncbi:MAG: alkaline phosphatase D family protein [Betaproteobacteria bacterium]